MPTGYTEIVEKGASFEEFVWRCARACSELTLMYDTSLAAKIPESFDVDAAVEHIDRSIAEYQADLERLRDPVAARARYDSYADAIYRYLARETCDTERLAYRTMLTRVEAWKPPSQDHAALKTFMVEQLQNELNMRGPSLDLDRPKPFEVWLDEAVTWATKEIDYYTEKRKVRIANVERANAWLAQLRASVPQP